MRRNWSPTELAQHWTILPTQWSLLLDKYGAGRLEFAVLLKAFELEGRFPSSASSVASEAVSFVAQQLGLPAESYFELDWEGRTLKGYRVQIRAFLGFRPCSVVDGEALVAWLSERWGSVETSSEALWAAAYGRLCELHLEPPTAPRLQRLLNSAAARFEARLFQRVLERLSPETCSALDDLIRTGIQQEERETSLFPVRSELAQVKSDAGAIKVDTVLEELAKLQQLRALALPYHLFQDVPARLVHQYRRRAASERPTELRRHPPEVRYTLLAALCWERQCEVTDTLVDLLIHIAHKIGVNAQQRVEDELLRHLKKVMGKTTLLYKLAKASRQDPNGTVRDVIYPAVSEGTLDALIAEMEAEKDYDQRVRLVTRKSYSHHYRRVVPALLEALAFHSNNEAYRPVMEALALLSRYRGRKMAAFPLKENVPLDGVVPAHWQELLLEDEEKTGKRRINRASYELCVITTIREKVRCKELWVQGASRYRNPDEDLPQDFERRRDEYYETLHMPRQAASFTERVKNNLHTALKALNADLPNNPKVRMTQPKKGKGRMVVTPLDRQPIPPNLVKLTAALVRQWPMTNLLDVLKETEWRVHFTDAFRSLGQREILAADVLQRRLLLTLHGLGTNAGLTRMGSGGGEDRYDDLVYVKRKYVQRDQLRTAIARVCDAIFQVRNPEYWGEGTTACASDSKKFGAWDQNLMTEWHARYGGPGIMVYWHVEQKSVCVYSQLKSCSSSEVASMIEGVLRHETQMEVDRTYVDTHGQSHVGFAFCHLLGFRLLPRLKNIDKQRLYQADKGEAGEYPNLQPVLSRPINWTLIEQQYDEMVKFATALRLGTADAESILRRFTQANVQHPTYRALVELGRALKTTFLCEYFRLESLRREIHEGLNVIENWNSANNFILYGKGGEFSTNKTEDQELLMLSLHLLQVSLVYVNTLMLQQVLAGQEWQGRLTDADRRGLSPLLWQHINPYGSFLLDMTTRIPLVG